MDGSPATKKLRTEQRSASHEPSLQSDDPRENELLSPYALVNNNDEDDTATNVEMDENYTLHDATLDADLKAIIQLVAAGADLDGLDDAGRTPLEYAAHRDIASAAKCLLAKGAKTEGPDNAGFSPLHFAAQSGSASVVDLLLRSGAHVNPHKPRVPSPLHFTTRYFGEGSLPIMRQLINYGANIDPEYDGATPLCWAICCGDVPAVRLLLDMGATLTYEDDSILHRVVETCQKNHPDLCAAIECLLTDGLNIHALDDLGRTPLHAAVVAGNMSLRPLLDLGSMINVQDIHDRTPLHLAAIFGNLDGLRLLVENGADEKAKADDGLTATNLIAIYNHHHHVEELINALSEAMTEEEMRSTMIKAITHGNARAIHALGAIGTNVNPFTKDNYSYEPLTKAVTCDTVTLATIETLIELGTPVCDEHDKPSPLHKAAYNGHRGSMTKLLEHGANICVRGKDGDMPMHWAAAEAPHETLAFLLSRGAAVDGRDDKGRTPLYYAARNGNYDALDFLIYGCDASIESRDQIGMRPLHIAASEGHTHAVARLVEAGADLNCTDDLLRTPLHFAAAAGGYSTVDFLLDHGASTNVFEQRGETPLHSACVCDDGSTPDMRTLIRRAEAIDGVPLLWRYIVTPTTKDILTTIIYLIELGNMDVNVPTKGGERLTPLHYAVRNRAQAAAITLVTLDADLEARDTQGCTPLHYASLIASDNSAAKFINLLASMGADVNARNNEGDTPMHIGIKGTNAVDGRKTASYIVRHLANSGANVNAANNLGETPLHLAVAVNDQRVIEELISLDADIHARTAGGHTPIDWATEWGNMEALELLNSPPPLGERNTYYHY